MRLRTARLTLRPPTAADAPAIFATYSADPVATRYMGWPRHDQVTATEWFVSYAAFEWTQHGVGTLLMFLNTTGALVGSTGLHPDRARPGLVATGYILGQPYWGQGLATECCHAMVDLARTRGDRELEALCHPAHVASAHVLEKTGFVFDGILRHHMVFPNLSPALSDVRRYVLPVTR